MPYTSKTRTNYIKVTDPSAWKRVIESYASDRGGVSVTSHTDRDGVVRYGFACDTNIIDLFEDTDRGYDEFLGTLSTVIAKNDALIITTLQSDGMKCLQAYAEIVTRERVESISLFDRSRETARRMLKNRDWQTINTD